MQFRRSERREARKTILNHLGEAENEIDKGNSVEANNYLETAASLFYDLLDARDRKIKKRYHEISNKVENYLLEN